MVGDVQTRAIFAAANLAACQSIQRQTAASRVQVGGDDDPGDEDDFLDVVEHMESLLCSRFMKTEIFDITAASALQ